MGVVSGRQAHIYSGRAGIDEGRARRENLAQLKHQERLRNMELSQVRQQQQFQAQNQSNRQRLLDSLLGGGFSGEASAEFEGDLFGGYRDRANSLIDQLGDADRLRINRGFEAAEQGALANLSDRGLGGSSSSANISLGTEREKQEALTGLEDQLLGKRLGVESDLFSQQAGLFQQLLGGIFSY
jgi:hypothetical protein